MGGVRGEPAGDLVGFGVAEEQDRLEALLADGRLRAAVIARGRTADGSQPAAEVEGRARFEDGVEVAGRFVVLEGERPILRSGLGAHAVITARGSLVLGFDPAGEWGRLDDFWTFGVVADHLRSRGVRLDLLPPVGVIRLDDTPGIALHQVQGRAKGDLRQALRLRMRAGQLRRASAVLNVAVAAEALDGGRRVPLDQVWPRSIEVMRRGVEDGVFEPVLHGLLHLDTEAHERGEIEFREFATLDAAEAGARLDRALAWQSRHLRAPSSFVAPAWAYGPSGIEEAERRGLVHWHRPEPGPLLEGMGLRETLIGELPGLSGVDFRPLQRLAAAGVPPVFAMHGALLDGRMQKLDRRRDAVLLARLVVRRDITRLLALDGIRWVGADELIGELGGRAERADGGGE